MTYVQTKTAACYVNLSRSGVAETYATQYQWHKFMGVFYNY